VIPNRCGTSKRQAQLRADDQGIWNLAHAARVDDVLDVRLNVGERRGLHAVAKFKIDFAGGEASKRLAHGLGIVVAKVAVDYAKYSHVLRTGRHKALIEGPAAELKRNDGDVRLRSIREGAKDGEAKVAARSCAIDHLIRMRIEAIRDPGFHRRTELRIVGV